jgi:hypothetical protein
MNYVHQNRERGERKSSRYMHIAGKGLFVGNALRELGVALCRVSGHSCLPRPGGFRACRPSVPCRLHLPYVRGEILPALQLVETAWISASLNHRCILAHKQCLLKMGRYAACWAMVVPALFT